MHTCWRGLKMVSLPPTFCFFHCASRSLKLLASKFCRQCVCKKNCGLAATSFSWRQSICNPVYRCRCSSSTYMKIHLLFYPPRFLWRHALTQWNADNPANWHFAHWFCPFGAHKSKRMLQLVFFGHKILLYHTKSMSLLCTFLSFPSCKWGSLLWFDF